MYMQLKIYQNGEQVNEITSTDKGEIFEHVAKIYRQKVDKLADRVEIVTGWSEIQRATVYAHYDNHENKRTKWAYKYIFDGVRL